MRPIFWLSSVSAEEVARGTDYLKELTDESRDSADVLHVCRFSNIWRDVNTLVSGEPLMFEGESGLAFLGGEVIDLGEPMSLMFVMDPALVTQAADFLGAQSADQLIARHAGALLAQFEPSGPESLAWDLKPAVEALQRFYALAQQEGLWVVKRMTE